MARVRTAAMAALSLGMLASAVHAAELPSRAGKAKAPEAAGAVKKCNVGGMTGVLAANGVCVKLSGSVTAGFAAGQIR